MIGSPHPSTNPSWEELQNALLNEELRMHFGPPGIVVKGVVRSTSKTSILSSVKSFSTPPWTDA